MILMGWSLKSDININVKREVLKESKEETPNHNPQKTLYFIAPYNPTNPNFKQIVEKHWPLLERSSATRPLIDCKLVFGYSRPKNICDIVTSAKLPTSSEEPTRGRTKKCNRSNCRHCPKINSSGIVTNRENHRQYKCIKHANCQTDNLI